ncbi:MAG: hypothetical protein Ct9H300mP28_12170 [Pseudomonadota bacterium]|nr:MAG: hypothetical protein Ct9H300mP28_12170 [Pseudomonadota bacterium]
MSEHSKVIEEYLLTLYKIDRLGERVKLSLWQTAFGKTRPPTVHATISPMQRDGLVDVKKTKVCL